MKSHIYLDNEVGHYCTYSEPMELKLLDPRAQVPVYKTEGSAGFDLVPLLDKPLRLAANESVMVSTGLSIHINNPLLAAVIIPRSGKGSRGLVIGNLIGLVDSDFTGPIQMCLWNRTDVDITIKPGEAVAQLVFVPVIRPTFKVVDEFSTTTQRGDGGFGHTDQKGN